MIDLLHEIKLHDPKSQTTITDFFLFNVDCDGKTVDDAVYNEDASRTTCIKSDSQA